MWGVGGWGMLLGENEASQHLSEANYLRFFMIFFYQKLVKKYQSSDILFFCSRGDLFKSAKKIKKKSDIYMCLYMCYHIPPYKMLHFHHSSPISNEFTLKMA